MNVDNNTAENIRRALSSDHTDPPTNNGTWASLVGNSRSLETQADNRSTHHRNHLPDAQKEEVVVEEAVEEEEMVEEDYLPQQDQACFLHMDEPLTQNS
jgi:hypothetical protein